MKLRVLFTFVLAFVILGSADYAEAQAPKTISYQGYLTDNDRVVVGDGNFSVAFRIYDQAGGGTALWTESKTVEVSDGVFTAILGQLVPLDLSFDKQYWLGISVNGTTELSPRTILTASPYSLFSSSIADGAVTSSSLAARSVTMDKLSVTGAESGQSLVFNGQSVAWMDPADTGVTEIDAGDGLDGGGSTATVNLSIADEGVTEDMIEDGAIVNVKIAAGTITGEKIKNNTIKPAKLDTTSATAGDVLSFDGTDISWMAGGGAIGEGSIETENLADKAVTGAKIADRTITAINLAANSVNSNRIAAAAVGLTKIDPSGALAGESIQFDGTDVVWGANAVTDGSIGTDQLALGAVTGIKIADRSITAVDLAVNSVINNRILDSAVSLPKIDADGAAAGESIQFDGTDIVWGSVAVADESIRTDHLADAAVTGAKIADRTITAVKLAANSVTTNRILDAAVSLPKINTVGALAGESIQFDGTDAVWGSGAGVTNGSIGTMQLSDGAVTAAKLAIGAVESSNILDGTVLPTDLDPSGAVAGDVLKFDGLNIGWAADAAASQDEGIGSILPGASLAADGALVLNGDLRVSGNVEKGAGSFKIDHPLDPENKFLYHSFVESDDMMNIYNGNVILDESGKAAIEMPAWFEALNTEFRYQLTTIGGFAPVYIASEISDGVFVVAGGTAGMKISWQVTGVRKDPYSNLNRIPVEQDKPAEMRGKLLHQDAYNKQ